MTEPTIDELSYAVKLAGDKAWRAAVEADEAAVRCDQAIAELQQAQRALNSRYAELAND